MVNEADVSLFFKISADASEASAEISQLPEGLQKVLGKLAKQLSISERAINSHSQRTQELGDSSARTANRIDKLSGNTQKLYGRLIEASQKFMSGEASAKQFSNAIRSVALQSENLRTSIKTSAAQIQDFQVKVEKAAQKTAELNFKKLQSNLGSLSSGLQSVGRTLATSVTLPLVGLAAGAIKSADAVFVLRNKVFSVTGSMETANQKISQFIKLAQANVGVTADMAAENFAFFKILGVNEDKIPNLITALGKLKTLAPDLPIEQLRTNLTQLFNEGFEIKDVRELTGKIPALGKILAEKFGGEGSDPASLQKLFKKMQENGNLTLDSFLEGFADAVNNDGNLSKLEDGFFAKLSKLTLPLQLAFEPLGKAIISAIEPVIPYLVSFLEQLSAGFSSLSPTFQIVVVAIGSIAAAVGPVLIALGAIVSAVSSVASALTFLTGTASVGAALSALAPIIGGVVAVVGTLAAVVAAFALAWQNNFGGIRNFTIEVFTKIKNTILPVMTEIYNFVKEKVDQIVAFWEANYPLIQKTVETVSNAVRTFIRNFLDTVYGFWESHGEQIKSIVSTFWNTIKTTISNGIDLAGNILKLAMQIINGDWSGAWATLLETIRSATATVVGVVGGFGESIGRLLILIIGTVIEFGIKFGAALGEYLTKAVIGAVYILATLPERLMDLIPKMIAAGRQIGSAIFQGIKDALAGRTIEIPYSAGQSANAAQYDYNPTGSGGDTSGLNDNYASAASSGEPSDKQTKAADNAAKEREQIAKRNADADAQLQILKNQLDESEKAVNESFESIKEAFASSGNAEAFAENINTAINFYKNEALKIIPEIERVENQIATGAKKTALQFKVLEDEQNKRQLQSRDLRLKIAADAEKLIKDAGKKLSAEEIQNTRDKIQNEVGLREAAVQTLLAQQEQYLAEKRINRENFERNKRNLILAGDEAEKLGFDGLLQFKKKKLEEELAIIGLSQKERAAIANKIDLIEEDILAERANQSKNIAEENKQSLEDQKKLAEELLAVKNDTAKVEQSIIEFRADQKRKRIGNDVDFLKGKAKIDAIIYLRDFELAEEARKEQFRISQIEKEKTDALLRVQGKQNEEQQKLEIENLYKEQRLLSEEEFQAALQEIKDRLNPQIEDAEGDGFFGSLFKSIDDFLANNTVGSLAEAFQVAGDIITKSLSGIAAGIGNVVENFVLYGKTGPAVLKKILASALASIAAESAVRAIFELAKGFAALFLNPAEAAGHFTAAALFGSIAGISAIAGRAIAGNSFNQESKSNNSFSGRAETSAANSFNSNNNNANSETNTVNENRINRQEQPVRKEYIFKIPRGMVSQNVLDDFNSAGPIRDGILRMVEG